MEDGQFEKISIRVGRRRSLRVLGIEHPVGQRGPIETEGSLQSFWIAAYSSGPKALIMSSTSQGRKAGATVPGSTCTVVTCDDPKVA